METVTVATEIAAKRTWGPEFGVPCPEGKTILSGGYSYTDLGPDPFNRELVVLVDRPVKGSEEFRDAWQVTVYNPNDIPGVLTVYAVCATVA